MIEEMVKRAKQAASQVFDDVEQVSHVGELPTGEHLFEARRRGAGNLVRVTLNPNNRAAGVEWSNGRRGSGYRVMKLHGIVPENQGETS